MNKTKSIPILVLTIFLTTSVVSVSAYAPIYPDDDPETVQKIQEYNQKKAESAKQKYRDRVLGETDENKTPEEIEAYKKQMQQQKQERIEKAKTQKDVKEVEVEKRVENRCELVEAKINNRLNNYETKRDKHVSQYNQIKDRLNGLLSNLNDRGCDVAKPQASMAELDTLIQEFAAANRAMVSDLENTRGFACGESQGEFASAVRQAGTHIPIIHNKAQAIRTFINKTLRPQISQAAQSCEAEE